MRPGVRGLLGISIALGLGAIGLSSVLSARRFVERTSVPTSRPSASVKRSLEPAPSASGLTPPVPLLPPLLDVNPEGLSEQREAMFTNMKNQLSLGDGAIAAVRAVFEKSRWISQGNPKITQHLMSRAECLEIRAKARDLRSGDPRCGAANMVPLYDPARETADQAKACIDQYEFPNIVCDYPVVWVKSSEAVELCRAVGKRICDAHEWEGACAGAVHAPETEYAFGERRLQQEYLHNKEREVVWAYGKTKDHTQCATGARKSPKCYTPSWELCGTNTYPAGAFPGCVSALGAYDQHGNAAEHMNLPLTAAELASRGGLGETEMKASWFIFQNYEAHEDDCRWRAPAWHATRVDDRNSHHNYHLGFRCCKDVTH
jgi:Sulfatase-modifying factor enzyme 1